MNYFDDYYSPEQPQQPQDMPNSYIPQENPKPPKVRKERKVFKRILCALVVVALVVGSCSATALVMNNRWQKEMNAMMKRMDEKITAAQKDAAGGSNQAPATTKPLASGTMTPGDVYAQNVNAVVAITVEVTGYDDFGRGTAGYSAGTGFIISQDGCGHQLSCCGRRHQVNRYHPQR